MERKKRKYSVDEKVNLAKIVAKHKDEYDNFESKSNYDSKRRKYTNSASGCGYLSKAVRDFYPSLKDKSSEDPEFKKAIQLARRKENKVSPGRWWKEKCRCRGEGKIPVFVFLSY